MPPPFYACEYLKAVSLLNIHAALLFQAKIFFLKCVSAVLVFGWRGVNGAWGLLADVRPRIQLITAVSLTRHVDEIFVCVGDSIGGKELKRGRRRENKEVWEALVGPALDRRVM